MPVEVKIPNIGESVSEVEITEWLKEEGEQVDQDEIIALIESEKATVELPAPAKGTLVEVLKKAGEPAQVGEIIARIAGEEGKAQRRETAGREGPERADGEGKSEAGDIEGAEAGAEPGGGKENAAARTKEKGDEELITYIEPVIEPARETEGDSKKATQKPAESDTTEDVEETEQEDVLPETDTASDARALPRELHGGMEEELEEHGRTEGQRKEELTPMSPIRKRIARRLLQAQHEAALLTTFNEIDMSAVIALRKDQGDSFRESHGVKLGFVSFFVKAATDALKRVREVNAKIRDNHIVYHTYYDIGVAIGSERGLFVPVLRNTDRMSFAEIEKTVDDLSKRAAANQLEPGELLGGTFTVSNGGIYGSLLSTPIVNPPQSGVLGLHAIQDRPVVRKNEVVIRPMMYVALTYDHRIIDGREAVTFLKRIKETIENPVRMLLGT